MVTHCRGPTMKVCIYKSEETAKGKKVGTTKDGLKFADDVFAISLVKFTKEPYLIGFFFLINFGGLEIC